MVVNWPNSKFVIFFIGQSLISNSVSIQILSVSYLLLVFTVQSDDYEKKKYLDNSKYKQVVTLYFSSVLFIMNKANFLLLLHWQL